MGTILAIGGGVAGLRVASNLADFGHRVILVEREAHLCGKAGELYKIYPTMEPARDVVRPLFEGVVGREEIEVWTYTEVEEISVGRDRFRAVLHSRPRYVEVGECDGCGACIEACPVEIRTRGGRVRKAVDKTSELWSFPDAPLIDPEACLRLSGRECEKCIEACERGAIDFRDRGKRLEVEADALVVATGLEQIGEGEIAEFTAGGCPDVLTGLDFERLLGNSRGGPIRRLSDREEVRDVLIVPCVGSRDEKRLPYCCRIGCMNALKHAAYVLERNPSARVFLCAIDVRAYGKYEEFYERVRKDVVLIRGTPPDVRRDPRGKLYTEIFDLATNRLLRIDVDLVVLEVGLVPSVPEPARKFCEVDEYGFAAGGEAKLRPVEGKRGVFSCGACTEPASVEEVLLQADSTSLSILKYLERR